MIAIHAGYNQQFDRTVIGLEADWSFMDWSDLKMDPNGGDIITGDIDSLLTIRARAGYLVHDVLVYGTAGIVWSDATYFARDNGTGTSGSVDFDDPGFVGGVGAETFIYENLSFRGELLWYAIGDSINTSGLHRDSNAGDFAEFEDAFVVRAGLTFHIPPFLNQ